MSDFDRVLERLLDDPGFLAALAADPAAALRGYQLTEDEWALLQSQIVAGGGGQGPVETRTSKSGLAGMFAPIAGTVGMGAAAAGTYGAGSLEPLANAANAGAEAMGQAGVAGAGAEAMGQAGAQGVEGLGYAGGYEGMGQAGNESIGEAGPGGPYAPTGGSEGFGAAGTWEGVGDGSSGGGSEGFGAASREPERGPELTDYRPNIDVDGDGRWDAFHAYARPGGGVEITADIDRDGQVDFVGYDADRDGRVDRADYDTDHDGVLDTRMHDDDGDGWLDRSTDLPQG
ncbi:hypothetical protein GCM10009682_56670 [Luedemannella flava]|uniref:EF-hand domain-containing protein n=1 Tax=Luedemannella flava TaxID=349316 RepID=A0ABN2MKL2_9ACTN